MGTTSSSLSELGSNEHLGKLSGTESVTSNDPFWNQLLSFSFNTPKNSVDQRLLEEATTKVCKNFAINNCHTGNFGSLIRVFLSRARELKASAQCDDSIFSWQTYNALFIIRNLTKYFVENLSEEVVKQQFDAKSPDSDGEDGEEEEEDQNKLDSLISCLMDTLIDVPILDFTYTIHLECINTLLILLSMQMFQPSPASKSHIFCTVMEGKCSIHAPLLMKRLMNNYTEAKTCPKEYLETAQQSQGLIKAVGSGLWNVMTLGLGSKIDEKPVEEVDDKPLVNQSLLLILVLGNHCTSEVEMHNPYREALFSFQDSQDSSGSSSPTEAVATFKLNYTELFESLCVTLREDQTTLLLYLLLHRNHRFKVFLMSRANIDQLVMPILKILYHAQEKNSHHIYMALIILLVLSEDTCFNKAVHEMTIKNVPWFKERAISEISLGGLLILVVIRTIQYNMTRMRDKYLHTNCLAALANMSSQFTNLHYYVAQRIVSLFSLLLKKHTKLLQEISHHAVHAATKTGSGSDGEEVDYDGEPKNNTVEAKVEDLAVLEEVIRMVLEIINSCLCHTLHHNPNLIYTLLYQKDLFNKPSIKTHPAFQDIIQNIDTVLCYFSAKMDNHDKNISVHEVLDVIKQGAVLFRKDKLKKFPELKFKYVEEESPEEFFIPYIWSLVYHSSNLYFNAQRIQIFSLSHGT